MATEFSKKKASLTREANMIAAMHGITLKGKVDFFGSFASYRIPDPEGIVTVKQAQAITGSIFNLIRDAGFDIEWGSNMATYHMGGVVYTWLRK